MSYSIAHTKRNGQHLKMVVDDVTTLPSLFCTIYLLHRLTKNSLGTQTNSLKALRYFYEFYERKHDGRTFDGDFFDKNFNIDPFLKEIDVFFEYLLSGQHTIKSSSYIPVKLLDPSSVAKESYVAHVLVVTRYFRFLNDRYTSMDYQDCSPTEVSLLHREIDKKIKQIVKEYNKQETNGTSNTKRYRSLTAQQTVLLNNMLIPSTEEFVDEDSGEVYPESINPQNPFESQFEQFRNYIIHRLMFQYGLRIGECLLLSMESVGPTLPDQNNELYYILLVQNLPDHIDDPRKNPPKVKTKASQRKIRLESNDYTLLTIYKEKRAALFKMKPDVTDHHVLFISSVGDLNPLSYDGVKTCYQKIDNAFIKEHPYFRTKPEINIEPMPKITPHVGRHTWAYMTLEFIYNKLFIEEVELKRDYGIRARMKGLLDTAADELRTLGGWTLSSNMPMRYANRFIEQVANESNTKRTNLITNRSEVPSSSTKDASHSSSSESDIDNTNSFDEDFDEFF
ncbi:site-specific integrase [Vibrio breoganii]|uniref:site-specific integrase n=1 Tax=Vibrio breoganii TaxID=553239 RepID=UPI000C84F5BC|nr:site-specific integrase [Vibrio breoganii]PMK57581.1 hypothetical protein BCT98_08540 [Vibrio breoganii]